MDYSQFKEKVKDALQEHFLGRGEVYYESVIKTNDTKREAVVLWQYEMEVRPAIYLEDLYSRYRWSGNFKKCVNEVIRACEAPVFISEKMVPRKWGTAKPKVFMWVVNREWNKEILENAPYVEYLDLAVIFYILIKEEGDLMATLQIDRQRMDTWGVDEQEMWTAAMENLEKEKFQIKLASAVMENVMIEMGGSEEGEDLGKELKEAEESGMGQLYQVCNASRKYAARAVLRKDLLKKYAKKLGGNFYILPSSVHEILLLKDDGIVTEEELKEMVYDVNHHSDVIKPEERLSDSVYYYDEGTDTVEIAS